MLQQKLGNRGMAAESCLEVFSVESYHLNSASFAGRPSPLVTFVTTASCHVKGRRTKSVQLLLVGTCLEKQAHGFHTTIGSRLAGLHMKETVWVPVHAVELRV